jgi:hypothetical protein
MGRKDQVYTGAWAEKSLKTKEFYKGKEGLM